MQLLLDLYVCRKPRVFAQPTHLGHQKASVGDERLTKAANRRKRAGLVRRCYDASAKPTPQCKPILPTPNCATHGSRKPTQSYGPACITASARIPVRPTCSRATRMNRRAGV